MNALALARRLLFRRPLPELFGKRLADPIGCSAGWRWQGCASSGVEVEGA